MAAYDDLLLSCGGGITTSSMQAKRDMDEAYLCIGLGGTGIAALRRLKEKVYQELQPDYLCAGVPGYDNIRFLAVDSDPCVERGRGKAKIQADEYFSIHQELQAWIRSEDGRKELKKNPLLNWMNVDKIQVVMAPVRQIGRYLLMKKSDELKRKITSECFEVLRHSQRGTLNIFVYAGISGGTGGGTFIDTCYIIRQIMQEQGWSGRVRVSGFFFLPDVVTSKPEVMRNEAIVKYNEANGYAALKELDYLMDLSDAHDVFHQKYNGFEITTNEAPVDLCFLVSAINADGQISENAFHNSMNVAAAYCLSYMLSPSDMNTFMVVGAHGVKALSIDCGANRCYGILGASDAEIPITQISTYLACGFYKKFESYVDRKAATEKATRHEIDRLAKTLGLTSNEMRDKVNADHRELMLPDVDFKILKECGPMQPGKVPECWGRPGNHWLDDNMGIRKKNEVTLARDFEGADIFDERQYVASDTKSIIVSTYLQLLDYCRNPEYGPYYAAAMLQNSGYDLRSVIDGSIEALKQSEGTINLQLHGRNGNDGLEQDIVQKSADFCESHFINEKKRYSCYKEEIRRWYEYTDELNQLETAIKVLQKLKVQLDDLYRKYFAPLIEMLDRLHDTFRENEDFLANKALMQPRGTFTGQILSVDEIKGSLDSCIDELPAEVTVHQFMDLILVNHREWLRRDEDQISGLVSEFFNRVFKEQLNTSLSSYLRIKFPHAGIPAVLSKMIQEIIKDVYVRSVPLFWSDPNFRLKLSTYELEGINVPQAEEDVCKAAEDFGKKTDTSIFVQKTDIRNHILVMHLLFGVPLYAYKGLRWMRESYENSAKISSGACIHLYEDTGRGEDETGFRNWRTYLPEPIPYSKTDGWSAGMDDKLKLYQKALQYQFIYQPKYDGMYYVHQCEEVTPKTYELKDFLTIDSEDHTQFEEGFYQKIMAEIQEELDHPRYIAEYSLRNDGDICLGEKNVESVRQDYFLHYPVLQNVVERNLKGREILKKEIEDLKKLKKEYEEASPARIRNLSNELKKLKQESEKVIALYDGSTYVYAYLDTSRYFAWNGTQWIPLTSSMLRWDRTKWVPIELDERGGILLEDIPAAKEEQETHEENAQELRTEVVPKAWDSAKWLEEFLPAWKSHNRFVQHSIRADYYQEHIKVVQRQCYLDQKGKKVKIPWTAEEMLKNTKYYSKEQHADLPKEIYDTVVEVWKMDCLDAAKRVQNEADEAADKTGKAAGKTAVLNMANRQNPGGGVFSGSGAQEESIFLRTNYFTSLYPYASYAGEYGLPRAKEQYPMDRNFGGIWSGGVIVFRGRELDGYPLLSDPWKTNFIAVAALNSPAVIKDENGELRLREDMVQPALNKIRTIFNIAADQDVRNLVLGAMGCGAFHNPPRHIAELFRQVLDEPEYKGRFERVVFAILGESLYTTFSEVLK